MRTICGRSLRRTGGVVVVDVVAVDLWCSIGEDCRWLDICVESIVADGMRMNEQEL